MAVAGERLCTGRAMTNINTKCMSRLQQFFDITNVFAVFFLEFHFAAPHFCDKASLKAQNLSGLAKEYNKFVRLPVWLSSAP